jgi:hypothetical protein
MREISVDTPLPTMKAGELSRLAGEFARELANRLEGINQHYPYPTLSPKAEIYLKEQLGGRIPGPEPSDYLRVFESIFCRYISSHYVITPDEE